MTRVTLENENGLYIIETKEVGASLCDMFDYYLNPLLLAATYQQSNIDDYFMQKGTDLYEDMEEEDCDCADCCCEETK